MVLKVGRLGLEVLHSRRHLARPGGTCGRHTWGQVGGAVAVMQGVGPTTKKELPQNVNTTEGERLRLSQYYPFSSLNHFLILPSNISSNLEGSFE